MDAHSINSPNSSTATSQHSISHLALALILVLMSVATGICLSLFTTG
jgi:hypothetical protein